MTHLLAILPDGCCSSPGAAGGEAERLTHGYPRVSWKPWVSPRPPGRGRVPSAAGFACGIRGGNQVTEAQGDEGLSRALWPWGEQANLCANRAPSAFFTRWPLCCQGRGGHAPLGCLPRLPREQVTHTVLRAPGRPCLGMGSGSAGNRGCGCRSPTYVEQYNTSPDSAWLHAPVTGEVVW